MDKEEVIKMTLELLKEKKLEKTSIGEIVKKLKASPGNLYYHFKNKNDIYKEAVNYSFKEMEKVLENEKIQEDKRSYQYTLTRALIRFLEEREEILFFLICIRASCYLDKEVDIQFFLLKFKMLLLEKRDDPEQERKLVMKLRMLFGSIYEVLYVNRFINKRNLSDQEIEEICSLFWGRDTITERYKEYKEESYKLSLHK